MMTMRKDRESVREGRLGRVKRHPDFQELFSASFAALKEKIKEAKQI